MSNNSHPQSRRKFLAMGLTAAAGLAGIPLAGLLAKRNGLLAPDYGSLYGIGDALTYASQRLLMATGPSLAREFAPADISTVHPVNHPHPRYDPYERLLFDGFVNYRLYVDGLVANPMAFSLDGLKSLPSKTQITELNCEEGWSYISAWTGVQLSLVLQLVRARPHARWVVIYPFDDFWGAIDMSEALHPQTLIAYAQNGADLTADHGAPIRLRVPRQVGYKNLKYVARITVTDALDSIGSGKGSAAPDIDYSWYGGI
jgi:DMSO/TMAO reductase YedYZ molybdopterin-dependent catalytic subunit